MERLERQAGARVRSIEHAHNRFGYYVFFENNKAAFIEEGAMWDGQFQPSPDPFCVSCGEVHGPSFKDYANRCSNTVMKIWESARKVYWHRHSQRQALQSIKG